MAGEKESKGMEIKWRSGGKSGGSMWRENSREVEVCRKVLEGKWREK